MRKETETNSKWWHHLSDDRGALLILITIFLLVLLGLLGISAMNRSTMSEQIAANEKLGKIAFYAADAGVQVGVSWLLSVYDVSYHLKNVAGTVTVGGVTCSPSSPCVQDPVGLTLGKSTTTSLNSGGDYTYTVVSLDPGSLLPAGYTAKARKQETEGYSAKSSSGYAGSTRMYNYYYQVDGNGNGPNALGTSVINATASYMSEN